MNGKDIFMGLSHIDQKYIAEAETASLLRQVPRRSVRRTLLIAALVAVMLLLAGCVAWMLRLQDLKITQTDYTSHYNAEGKHAAPTEMTIDVISLRGYPGSANQNATLEWFEFEQTYDPERELLTNTNENGIPDEYWYVYGCYTWDMVAEVDRITEKYGLKLLSPDTVVQRWQRDVFFEALEIEGMCHPDKVAEETAGSGYFYPEGNFKYDFDFTLPEGEGWSRPVSVTMLYAKKEYFDPDYHMLEIDLYDQWNYTTAQGIPVLIAFRQGNGFLFAETGDAYITLLLNTTMLLPDHITDRATAEDFQRFADAINFAVAPKTENMAAAIPAMEEADAAYWAAQEGMKPDYSDCAGYSDYLLHHMGFSRMSSYFGLADLNGDGVEDLLTYGTEDSFTGAMTMVDGEIRHLLSVNESYLCENHVMETVWDNGPEAYRSWSNLQGYYFNEQTPEAPPLLDIVMYHGEENQWYAGTEYGRLNPVTQAQADAIRAKYTRAELTMIPMAQWPMDETGTTLYDTARAATDALSDEEKMDIYRDLVKKDQEKSYVPSTHFCLRDINGDGITDLLLSEDGIKFSDAYTIFNGKAGAFRTWSSMYLCEGGFIETHGTSSQGEGHTYYSLDEYGMHYLENIYWSYYPEAFYYEAPGVKDHEIPREEFDRILDGYTRMEVEMTPIDQFPAK